MTTPRLTAVLACHNRRDRTLACLEALLNQDRAVDLRVVLFDDGSGDGTAAAVRRRVPEAHIITGDGSAFWAGGMRAAFAAASATDADFMLWLNDDVHLASDAVGRLLDAYRGLVAEGHGFCLVGGAVVDPIDGRTTYAGIRRPSAWRPLRFQVQPPDPVERLRCDTLVGNVVLVPRLTAARVGGIGTAYRHTLGDLDYGLRVTAAGGWVGLAPGHCGTCAREGAGRWFDPALPLRARWRLVGRPLGFPLRPWLHFARQHGGPFWFAFAALPFWRLLVPPRLARLVDRMRRDPSPTGRTRHA
ncbi:glycosyltransferase [Lichenihabitans sp. Uapishka_5]|uniref:glycosyltransferase family 2 protein n=1 Tax=Lichenihabitans sp. Uapishka_5 TaxID=3037302 RepID=UPI0029E7E67A|nr:glycosyltransferase [Lichenihabitans sp. Uapishka_5]MDX7953982.1 glycosyltransferase [Lichenihabitans sp. Uapishka_5]